MQYIIAVEPEEMKSVSGTKLPIAYSAYKIGGDGRLYRAAAAVNPGRGYMILSAETEEPPFDMETVSEIMAECGKFNFSGVFANFRSEPLLDILSSALSGKKLRLMVHEELGVRYRQAWVVVSTSMSGGTLRRRLYEASEAFGAERIVLDVERVCKDFVLPAPDGEGRDISRDEFSGLTERLSPEQFFSPELCCQYFFYTENGETHFILFDNLGSIKSKLSVAESLGISKAMFLYGEMKGFLKSL